MVSIKIYDTISLCKVLQVSELISKMQRKMKNLVQIGACNMSTANFSHNKMVRAVQKVVQRMFPELKKHKR